LATSTVGSRIEGGGGSDTLIGSSGADTLVGGAGADRFFYNTTSQSSLAASDTISDFSVGEDLLVFDGLLSGSFSMVSSFTNTGNSQASWNGGTNTLTVDTDGNGVADMKLNILGGVSISETDFQWS
jgi:Ca2+-binding RTX toxin-like protein